MFNVGDIVYWKGIKLVVTSIDPNGSIHAHSLTMHLVVSDGSQLWLAD